MGLDVIADIVCLQILRAVFTFTPRRWCAACSRRGSVGRRKRSLGAALRRRQALTNFKTVIYQTTVRLSELVRLHGGGVAQDAAASDALGGGNVASESGERRNDWCG